MSGFNILRVRLSSTEFLLMQVTWRDGECLIGLSDRLECTDRMYQWTTGLDQEHMLNYERYNDYDSIWRGAS